MAKRLAEMPPEELERLLIEVRISLPTASNISIRRSDPVESKEKTPFFGNAMFLKPGGDAARGAVGPADGGVVWLARYLYWRTHCAWLGESETWRKSQLKSLSSCRLRCDHTKVVVALPSLQHAHARIMGSACSCCSSSGHSEHWQKRWNVELARAAQVCSLSRASKQ